MTKILETERLTLRELSLEDADFFVELLNSPGWLQFIGDRNVKTVEAAQNYMRNGAIRSYRQNGFGLWLVQLKESKIPIGLCGLIRREGLDDVDIGFAFLPEYMGKGYAFEVAIASLKYGQDILKLNRIVAITNPDNELSIKLLQKIGLTYEKDVKLNSDAEVLLLFATENKL